MADTALSVSHYSLRNVDDQRLLPYAFRELFDAFVAATEIVRGRDACLEIIREDGTLAMTVYSDLRHDTVPAGKHQGSLEPPSNGTRMDSKLPTNEVDPSLRHLPKLTDQPVDCEPIYCCQLCKRRGTRGELMSDECPARSGAMKRITADPTNREIA